MERIKINPILIILILLAGVLLWILCSFLYIPIGRIIHRIARNAIDEMNKNDNENEQKEKLNDK